MIMFYEEHDLVRARMSKNHQKIVNNSLNRLTKTAISKQIVFNNDFKSVSSQRKPEEECTRHPNVTIAENIYEKKPCRRLHLVKQVNTVYRKLS